LPATPGPIVTPPPPIVTPPPAPADCTAERALIALMKAEGAKLMDRAEAAEAELSAVTKERDDARRERLEDIRSRFTAAELLKLVNDATGQMAGYWRYLGVQGAVDRAVKAELAKRK
jgi:hypothetical protein